MFPRKNEWRERREREREEKEIPTWIEKESQIGSERDRECTSETFFFRSLK
jgi:hypothetical protein